MTDSTNDLVASLVGDLTPVRPTPPIRVAVATVMALSLMLTVLVLWPRRTVLGAVNLLVDDAYTQVTLGFLMAAVGGTIAAIASGRPDRENLERRSLAVGLIGWALAALACAIGLFGLGEAGLSTPSSADVRCLREALLISIVPTAIVSLFVLRGWAHSPLRSAAIILVAAGSIGGAVIHLGCGTLHAQHMLFGHVSAPLALAVVAAYPLGTFVRGRRG